VGRDRPGYREAVPGPALTTALRPRWLASLVVVLVASSGMAALGSWQLDRAHERSADAVRERQSAAPRELPQALRARQTFPGALVDAPVTARGSWDLQGQLLVAGREHDGIAGFWVLTPFVLQDGSAVPVVRGWVADPGDAGPAAAEGPVTLRGVLRPAEGPPARVPGDEGALPAGQIAAVDVADLVKRWPRPLLTGYVVATDPRTVAGLVPVDPVAQAEGGLALQNLSYALQWWIFAAVGLLFWWRLVRDDARGKLRPRAEGQWPPSAGPEQPAASQEQKAERT
jgi:cytochrome oxidase assembly protein ShyY1